MLGIVEVILLLLGLSNFGLQANPTPPTADTSLQYAMADADVVLHVDAATFVPNNYKALLALETQPQIKASPELLKIVRELVVEVDGGRRIVKSAVGIDVTTDIANATLFAQLAPQGPPSFVAAVRGKFPATSIDKIAALTSQKATKIGGGAMVEPGGDMPAVGLTKDGVLLAGTPKLVRERLADTWRAPARPAGGLLAHAAEVIAQKPVFATAFSLTATTRKMLIDKHGSQKNFLTDLIQRHKAGSFALYPDGVGWTWIDRDKAGLDSMAQMSEGALDLMRAAQIAPRGMAKFALAALESYRGTDKKIDELLKRKADITKIVESYSGDGNFKIKVDKNPATLRLDVRATGKSLSEVLPVGAIVPMAGVVLLGTRMKEEMSAPPPVMVPAPQPGRPAPAGKGAPAPKPAPKPAPAARP
ncbi:MAG TPA: hypothetical protein VNO30_32430 [Kofleriaceae bacterium]|nr:hypothetical protein [Kofleriaceae bacterium]